MVLLVGQGLCGLGLWRTLQATGAELVWRCRQDVTLPVLEVFGDGSWRSELGQSQPTSKRVAVRVIDYHLDDPGRPGQPGHYRLITGEKFKRLRPFNKAKACWQRITRQQPSAFVHWAWVLWF